MTMTYGKVDTVVQLTHRKFNLYFNFVCNCPFVVGQIFLCFCFFPLSPIVLLLSVCSAVLVYPVLIVFAILSPSVPSFSLFLCVSLNCLICSNFTSLSIPFSFRSFRGTQILQKKIGCLIIVVHNPLIFQGVHTFYKKLTCLIKAVHDPLFDPQV